jgi:hypothetical protein
MQLAVHLLTSCGAPALSGALSSGCTWLADKPAAAGALCSAQRLFLCLLLIYAGVVLKPSFAAASTVQQQALQRDYAGSHQASHVHGNAMTGFMLAQCCCLRTGTGCGLVLSAVVHVWLA